MAIGLATMWLQMNGRKDGLMDRLTDGWTHRWRMFLYEIDAIDAYKNNNFPTNSAIFTKASRSSLLALGLLQLALKPLQQVLQAGGV